MMKNPQKEDDRLLFLLFPMGITLETHSIFSRIRKILGCIWLLWIPVWDSLFAVFMLQDWKFFQEYFTFFVVAQMVFIFVFIDTLVFDSNTCLDISQLTMKYGLPWKSAGQELHDTLLYEAKMLKKVMVSFMFGAIVLYQIFLPYPDLCQPFHRMGQKYFEEWVNVIDITYYAVFPFTMGYGTGCFFWKMAYLFRQSRIQCDILNRLLTNISEEIGESTCDEEYQRRVHENLMRFVKSHQHSKKLIKLLFDKCRWTLVPIYLISSLAAVSIIYLSMQGYRTTGDLPRPRLLLILTMYGFASYIMIDGGQQLINKSEHIFHIAYGCRWYKWNRRNKQILFLIMTNSLKPLTFSSYGLLDLGYDTTCSMANISFSFMALLRNIQERNKGNNRITITIVFL